MKPLKTWAAALACLTLAGTAQAALVDRGGGLIYDSTQDLTWMADLRHSLQGGVYGVDGMMNWEAAKAWADGLVFGGHDDWRLPEVNPADATCTDDLDPGGAWGLQAWGYNCSQGEITRLFHDELGVDFHNVLGDTPEQLANRNLFTGHGPLAFWTATPYAPDADLAWAYNPGTGFQRWAARDVGLMVMVVRDGDVAQRVPEPASPALVMLALGAGGLLTTRRRPRSSRGD